MTPDDSQANALELKPLEALAFFPEYAGSGGADSLSVKTQRLVQRALWLTLVVLSLPLWLPVLVLLMVAVKLDSPGPIFFSQDQLGRQGRRIRPLKFRTMHLGAEARLQALLAAGGPLAEEYARHHKLKADPRVTRVGRLLRRTSLDELPQLWNVLAGDMSLVGPRPYLPRELPAMGGHEGTILQVRPGLTGLWQVSGRNQTTFAARVQFDVAYVQQWSLWQDLRILGRTLWVVLLGVGAY
jgi:lipopolysaccharide/colanic/teichoic acid biosynthesis glycosyltransferase